MIHHSFETEQGQKESESSRSSRERVSIVICTKGRPLQLQTAIASIRNSSPLGSKTEIVIVEETSVPRAIQGVRYVPIPEENRGFGYARNRGVQEARGEIIVFIDDDCKAEEGWLEALLEPLLDQKEVVGVAGAVAVRNCGTIGLAENILGFPGGGLRYWHYAQGKVNPIKYLSTCNCAYRKKSLQEAGGFDEHARYGGEDFLLAERVNRVGLCVYAPAAVVYHEARGSLGKIFLWFIRRGKAEFGIFLLTQMRRNAISYFLQTSLTLRAVVILGVLILWPPLAFLLLVAPILYILVILWRFRFACLYPVYRRAWICVPFVKIVMDVGIEVGRWKAWMAHGRDSFLRGFCLKSKSSRKI